MGPREGPQKRGRRWRRVAGVAGVFGGVTTLAGFPPGVTIPTGDGSGINEPPLHWISHASAVPVLAALILMLIGMLVLRRQRMGVVGTGLAVAAIGAMVVAAAGDVLITWAATVQDETEGGLYFVGHDLQSLAAPLGTSAMALLAVSTLRSRAMPPGACWLLLATVPVAALLGPALHALGADGGEALNVVLAGMGVTWAWWGVDLLQPDASREVRPAAEVVPWGQH